MEKNTIKYLKRIAQLLESGECYARSYHMMCDEFLPSSDLTPEEIAQAIAEEEEQERDWIRHQEWLECFISDLEQFLNEEEG